jgi:uncharacterized protein YkwD
VNFLLASLAAAVLALAPAHHQPAAYSAVGASHSNSRKPANLESQLLEQMNAVRVRRGLHALRLSRPLTAAARRHSASMAQKGYFSHASADGTSFWKRVASFYDYRGHRRWSVGENLLWASPDVTVAGAVKMWLRSPDHRANLLDHNWREIGISAVHAASARGIYGGRAATIVTADFGYRY